TLTPSPATALAMRPAATSSDISSASSRATTTSPMPAASSAAASVGPTVVPLRSTKSPWRMVWTVTPPMASRGASGPHFMPPSSCLFGLYLAQPQCRGDLAHDRHRDLGRRHRADIEPDGRMDRGDLRLRDAGGAQPLDARGVG